MDEDARFDVAIGVDMAVIAAASDTAVDELAIVLEIDGENRLATLYAADFADPAYHIGPLFFCRQQVQRGVVADGHIMEVPRKPDVLLDEQVQEFVRRDGVDVFPGITDGRPKNDAVLAQEVHGVYDLVEIAFAAAAVIDFTESFDTEGEAEIAYVRDFVAKSIINERTVGKSVEFTVRVFPAQTQDIFLAHERFAARE